MQSALLKKIDTQDVFPYGNKSGLLFFINSYELLLLTWRNCLSYIIHKTQKACRRKIAAICFVSSMDSIF